MFKQSSCIVRPASMVFEAYDTTNKTALQKWAVDYIQRDTMLLYPPIKHL